MEFIRLNRQALTLLEILVAIVLIGLFTIGISASFAWIQNTNALKQRQFQALDFAKETLEDLLMRDYTDVDLNTGYHTSEAFLVLPAYCELNSAARYYEVEEQRETIQGSDTLIGKKLTISLAWTEAGQPKEEKLFGLVIQK